MLLGSKMSFNCFMCSKLYASVQKLLAHLKINHSLKNYDNFVSAYKDCGQKFSYVYSYKRHIIKHNNKMQKWARNGATPACATAWTNFEENVQNNQVPGIAEPQLPAPDEIL